MKKHSNIYCVDLFCGIGGLTHGLQRAGINVVAGIDIDTNSEYPYSQNNNAAFLAKDVSDVTAADLRGFYPSGSITLLAGCAPCQPFSTYSQSSRKGKCDERWSLLKKFGALIQEVKPDMVTMENVPQLMRHEVFESFIDYLDGYSVAYGIVECEKYSIPQTRKRLVLIASKISEVTFQDILDQRSSVKSTVKESIGHLVKIKAGQSSPDDPIHMAPRLSPLNHKRIKASKPGGTWRDWSESLRADCHKKKSGATYPSVYGRMEWGKPSPTITTQCFGYGNGRFGPPEQHRAISLREAAILQSFPEDYIFLKTSEKPRFSAIGRLIGNAVPVRVVEVVGNALIKSIRSAEILNF